MLFIKPYRILVASNCCYRSVSFASFGHYGRVLTCLSFALSRGGSRRDRDSDCELFLRLLRLLKCRPSLVHRTSVAALLYFCSALKTLDHCYFSRLRDLPGFSFACFDSISPHLCSNISVHSLLPHQCGYFLSILS